MSDCKSVYSKVANDPFLDKAMRGWIFNTARKNYWRVSSWIEFEDLVADGYLCYYKCRNRYTLLTDKADPLPEDKKRFMGLVQAAFSNHITNLANRRTAVNETALSACFDEDTSAEQLDKLAPPQFEEATLRVLLATAPKEVVALLELLLKDGRDTVPYARTRIRRVTTAVGERVRLMRRGRRESPNEHYCRRLGLDYRTVDIISLVRSHLGYDDTPEPVA